jgi:exopolysaccharide biosynthesis polyprenyl glycosylphosphotransferase
MDEATESTPRTQVLTPHDRAGTGRLSEGLRYPLGTRRFRRRDAPSRPRTFSYSADALIAEAPARTSVLSREHAYRYSVAVADACAAVGAVALALTSAASGFEPLGLIAAPLLIALNKVAGLYERDELVIKKTTLEEAPALLKIAGLFTLVTWLVRDVVGAVPTFGSTQVLVLWLSTFALLIAGRATARRLARDVSAPERCLLIGETHALRSLERKLMMSRTKADVIGTIATGHRAVAPEDLAALVRRHDVHRLIIAPTSTDAADTLDLVRSAKALGVRVSLLPRLLEVVGSSVEFDDLDGLTILGVRRFGLARSSGLVKRAFDLVGAATALVVLGPFMLAVAVLIRLDTPGAVLFRQVRVGRHGQRFHMYKFRSMVADADARKADLIHLNEASGLFKITDDPRITRVGRLLRRTSLDELPQLLNVLRGEMSLVGPRPLVVDEDALIEGHFRGRLHLTPGMTGPWQILGSARIPLEEMIGIDYLYVTNWSLWSDFTILLRTVPYVLSRRGM